MITPDQIKLVETCGACPEQYDAYYKGVTVGYLRLRHGSFRVDCYGETIFGGHPRGDGCFEWEERDHWLQKAKEALASALNEAGIGE